ncbi:hypothetical protein [Pararcticibacter amylolyticus]|uniref:1,4-alpha-glucan branching enzyme n=1 Tax=Pararcticibacter amylolyticus TaxID=2173175 RepID=A0A2U2PKQ1_9SPHI|nr:hypothetical protein [Pararcticibacter amylolyticus]PWG81739.1 hypothetical protein DDR33_05075 [Pararcticibacter amylolyticus]
MSSSNQTHDHAAIKKWAEERGGVPVKIKNTGDESDEGVLRIHFPEHSDKDDQFEEISWDDFFDNFERNKLDFLFQDEKADGEQSTFHKFVQR